MNRDVLRAWIPGCYRETAALSGGHLFVQRAPSKLVAA